MPAGEKVAAGGNSVERLFPLVSASLRAHTTHGGWNIFWVGNRNLGVALSQVDALIQVRSMYPSTCAPVTHGDSSGQGPDPPITSKRSALR